MLVRLVPLATVAALLFTVSAHAADPAVSCESGKLKTAGKYASCVLSADSKAAKTGDPADYSKCVSKFGDKWSSSEAAGMGMCPGGTGDQSGIQDFLDACEKSVGNALASGAPPFSVGGVRTFADNGDGTITDNVTGLMWEKLSDDGSIHDKDNAYTWADASAVKVTALNSATFAGHNDWRVPSSLELYTLVNPSTFSPATYSTFNTGCVAACTVTTCSCTDWMNVYWSSTTNANAPTFAWLVFFYDGDLLNVVKTSSSRVRAVRGGS